MKILLDKILLIMNIFDKKTSYLEIFY
jgi:hypothetical protein